MLFMLQTRDGKRTGLAALRIALDMRREGLVSAQEAVQVRASCLPDTSRGSV